MASMGIEAIKKFADSGEKPKVPEGKTFVDTGATLITDKPAEGVESIDTKAGMDKCWG
jgi:fructose transport system substrate-binding protein